MVAGTHRMQFNYFSNVKKRRLYDLIELFLDTVWKNISIFGPGISYMMLPMIIL